jgi:hypothetical protein
MIPYTPSEVIASRYSRHQGDERREPVQEGLRHGGLHHFLEQQLEHVGERLEDALADVHRPVAHVHPADQLALPHDVEGDGHDHRHGDREHLEHDPGERADRAPRQEELTNRIDERHHARPISTLPVSSAAVAP